MQKNGRLPVWHVPFLLGLVAYWLADNFILGKEMGNLYRGIFV